MARGTTPLVTLLNPASLTPPHRVTRPEQVDALAADMVCRGWHGVPLVGYLYEAEIQLLSGTHRRAAAERARILVPVLLYTEADIREAWGTDQWAQVMEAGAWNEQP